MKILFILLFFLACSPKNPNDTATIHFKFRDFEDKKGITFGNKIQEEGNWGLSDPTSVTQFDCFGIFINYPEVPLNSTCTDSSGGTLANPHVLLGLVSKNSELLTPVKIGTNRKFSIVGFDSTLTDCPSVNSNFDSFESQLSAPFLLGSTVIDIKPSSTVVEIKASYTAGSTPKINDCKGPLFDWSDPNSPPPTGETQGNGTGIFGSGNSGDATISGTISNTSSSSVNGRVLQPSSHVSAIDGTGKVLTLLTSPFIGSADHYQSNDEVMWIVNAAGNDSSLGCGPTDLSRGRFGFSGVSATSTNSITLSNSISSAPSSIIAANLTATPTQGSGFCRIQITRVPNFNNLTIDATSGSIDIYPKPYSSFFDSNPHAGGIFIVRVKETLTLNGTNNITIDASGKGFSAATINGQGQGVNGLGNDSTSGSGNAGGGSSSGSSGAGGGGGAVANGGAGSNFSASAGISSVGAVSNCPNGTPCMLFGGAGGKGSNNGGNGGGIVIIWAKNVIGSANLFIKANGIKPGVNGAEGNGGGGAGMVTLETMNLSIGSFFAEAVGGGSGDHSAPPSSNHGGGAGGGGNATIKYCSSLSNTNPSVSVSGGPTSTNFNTNPGQNGSNGFSNISALGAGVEFCP